MTNPEIDLAFGFNLAYAPHAAAVIASVVRAAPESNLRFIILHDGISPECRARVESVAPNAKFHWAELGADDVPEFAQRGHFNRANLFRLGLEKHAPADCRRVLYLDADIVVLGDVRELWAQDLAGAPIGAVVDYEVDTAAFAQRWALPEARSRYFNSGVLLIDLDQVREKRLFSAAIDVAASHGDKLLYADQCALNVVMWNNWRSLPPSWNAQKVMVLPGTTPALPEALRFHDRLPHVVHFTGHEKPWTPGGYHPWSWLYWENLARTPFLREVTNKAGELERWRAWLRWMRRRPRAYQR